MIVPDHWAEARQQHRTAGKQITVRRYGWSVTSQADAQAMAETRAQEALQRILVGEKLDKREPKIAYNGAAGVPIREEVLARHGEQVITRNGYGARCLNSPNALFADIDFTLTPTLRPTLFTFAVLALGAGGVAIASHSWRIGLGLLLLALFLTAPVASTVARLSRAIRGGADHIARARLAKFLSRNPAWNVRLYQTPAGLRVLATHQAFDAQAAEVQAFFTAVDADPVYARMCFNQRCFRARLTAKPWRIGIPTHMRPRPGIWPIQQERMEIRSAWVADYEAKAQAFAACRYLESMGSGTVHPDIEPVIELHDQESRALVRHVQLA
jgi:hypothetical protein